MTDLKSCSVLAECMTKCDWPKFEKRLGSGGKNDIKLSEKKRKQIFWKWKIRVWFMIGHKQTGNGELKWGQLFQIKAHGRHWGQCQWSGLKSGSLQATLHHHHYHHAASITGHGPEAHRSDASESFYFRKFDATVRKCYNCSFTGSSADMTAVLQCGGGHQTSWAR